MTDRGKLLHALSIGVLVVGVIAAVLIYHHAALAPDSIDFEDNKSYLRQMEMYGGKGNVMAEQIRDWFSGLWHGKSLAFTVVFLSVLTAGGLRLAAIPLPPLEGEETTRVDRRSGS
jgi:hypothetical protein